MNAATRPSRQPTPIDQVAEDHVDTLAALDPITATAIGLTGYDHLMTDYSPGGIAERTEAARSTLTSLVSLTPQDEVDLVTLAAMRERLGLQIEVAEAGEFNGELNNIESPLQAIREVFDAMPTTTIEEWVTLSSRLYGVSESVDSYIANLKEAAAHGQIAAQRQVKAGIQQAAEVANPASSFFTTILPEQMPPEVRGNTALSADVTRASGLAAQAYGRLAVALGDLLPNAPQRDAVGRDRYALWSRMHIGAAVDLDETYAWGITELAKVAAAQEAVAAQIAGPGATLAQAVAKLDADPARILHGTQELQRWMQETADEAVAMLADTHFDIPEPARTIECRIAPTQFGGIYYTRPSDDFARPGRMWWAVPPEQTTFGTWREKTIVYHEGVPGHHLQVGQTIYRRELLNRWRRLACWVSGHGEGWALYAEGLMAELGFLEDPGDQLGLLDNQRVRAARVVLDIGVHLELPCPVEFGGGTWDYDKAWTFFSANVNMPEALRRFEVDRYLGWPGQASSYKVGERIWHQTRERARAESVARGAEFSLKEFHRRALDLGSVGLDVLAGIDF